MATPSVEDYLKAIYKVELEADAVTAQDIAAKLQVSAAAVSKMLKRLQELRLVDHTPYQNITLTSSGRKMALEIVRHHRLLELYLVEALGYSWDEVHVEAERLEHHISEEFEQRIDTLMGHPTRCPHGDPIPDKEGNVASITRSTLATESPGRLVVSRVSDADASLLRFLKNEGLFPGTDIELIEQEPFGGAFLVRLEDRIVRIAPDAARQIFVEPAEVSR